MIFSSNGVRGGRKRDARSTLRQILRAYSVLSVKIVRKRESTVALAWELVIFSSNGVRRGRKRGARFTLRQILRAYSVLRVKTVKAEGF